ncbi:GNAT family N-acetyltransferase [Persephonella sp.]
MKERGKIQDKLNLKLKNFSEKLRDDVIKILFDAYQDLPEYGEKTYKDAKRYVNWLKNHSTYFKVAYVNQEPAGFVVADAHYKNRPAGEIHELSVRKKFWGIGLGNMLLEEAEKHLKNEGKDFVGLWVGRKNLRAIDFYKKHGYKESDIYRDWLRMTKRL